MDFRLQRPIRRCLSAVLCGFLLLWGLSGCSQMQGIVSNVNATGEFPVTVGETTIGARPQKVVVLSPSLADVVLALGCETQLAAGSEDCTQESLSALQKVDGNDSQAVISLGPDLVLADPGQEGMASAIQEAGITYLEIAPATDREDFERLYSQVSSAFLGGGTGYEKGIAAAQDIFTTLDDINRIVPKEKVTTVCYLYDLDGSAVTGDMFGSTVMSYAGVTNVFKSLSGGTYDFESLRVSNPTVIFCVPGLKSQIMSDSRFAGFQAVRNGRVVEMDPSLMERQGRTVVTTAYEISAACFPELLEENSRGSTDPASGIESAVNSALASQVSYTALQQGDQNEDVLELQKRLDELGYLDTEYDGHYGEYTAGCVREFQKANGLEETGMADETTLRKLYAEDAVKKDGAVSGDLSSQSQS